MGNKSNKQKRIYENNKSFDDNYRYVNIGDIPYVFNDNYLDFENNNATNKNKNDNLNTFYRTGNEYKKSPNSKKGLKLKKSQKYSNNIKYNKKANSRRKIIKSNSYKIYRSKSLTNKLLNSLDIFKVFFRGKIYGNSMSEISNINDNDFNRSNYVKNSNKENIYNKYKKYNKSKENSSSNNINSNKDNNTNNTNNYMNIKSNVSSDNLKNDNFSENYYELCDNKYNSKTEKGKSNILPIEITLNLNNNYINSKKIYTNSVPYTSNRFLNLYDNNNNRINSNVKNNIITEPINNRIIDYNKNVILNNNKINNITEKKHNNLNIINGESYVKKNNFNSNNNKYYKSISTFNNTTSKSPDRISTLYSETCSVLPNKSYHYYKNMKFNSVKRKINCDNIYTNKKNIDIYRDNSNKCTSKDKGYNNKYKINNINTNIWTKNDSENNNKQFFIKNIPYNKSSYERRHQYQKNLDKSDINFKTYINNTIEDNKENYIHGYNINDIYLTNDNGKQQFKVNSYSNNNELGKRVKTKKSSILKNRINKSIKEKHFIY